MPHFLHEVITHNDGRKLNNGYWELEYYAEPGTEIRVFNEMGGFHYHIIQEDDDIIYAESRRDLDHSFLLDPNSELGWLAPDGTFYGCAYYDHENVAYYVLKSSSMELEEKGWVKIYESRLFGLGRNYYLGQKPHWKANYMSRNFLTKQQIDWLLEHGYKEMIIPEDVKEQWEEMFDGRS